MRAPSSVPIRAGAVTGLLNECVTRRQDWFELSAPHHGSSLTLNLPESEAVPLPPLSVFLLVCARGGIGGVSHQEDDRQTQSRRTGAGLLLACHKKRKRKFYLCAKWNSDKWSAHVDRRRTRDTSCISFFPQIVFALFMVNRTFKMNLQWSSPAPCIRRVAHKRLDSDDQPPAKCARLSVEAGDAPGLLSASPGSPVSPVAKTAPLTHQGPARIGHFLLLPLAERDGMCSAMNTDTGDELLCKVYDMGLYQEKIRAYGILPAHRNVAGIRDIILGERKAYVFLEKDFGDMHTLVKSCRRLDEEQACRVFRQVSKAVAHCHQAGIVLGDLKLRKFVFADEKRTHVRLESLEDCRILEDPEHDAITDTHGCPAYVSPEILSGSTPYSGKMADMWSLGVMLYTMLVGRYPFHDPDPATLFSKIRRGQCCFPEGLSPKARCLLQNLLRKDPTERLTATEMLAHPWFHLQSSCPEAPLGEHKESSAEQTVPSFDIEEDDGLFC